ncbi:MAG: DUF2336 domain-containing protein [Nitratireductor sp.]
MIIERFLTWFDTAPLAEKAAATNALARAYLLSPMEEEEAGLAEAAMTVVLDDDSSEVRHALADALADSDQAPRHIIMALACDSVAISSLVLSRSPLLVDAELIDIAATGACEQQFAVASRYKPSQAVCDAIATHSQAKACLELLCNETADISRNALHVLSERFGDNADIRGLLVQRPELQPRTRVLLLEKLSIAYGEEAERADGMSPVRKEQLIRDTCEKATITYAAQAHEHDLHEIVDALIQSGKMNAAFLLRAICMGNIALFATALAQLSDMPFHRVEAVLAENRAGAFRALYAKAELPASAFSVFAGAVETWRTLLASQDEVDPARLPYLVTREVLKTYHPDSDGQVDALLVLLRRLAAEAARENARAEVSRITREAREREMILLAAPQQEAVIEIAPEILADFALHFADEIVGLEEELLGIVTVDEETGREMFEGSIDAERFEQEIGEMLNEDNNWENNGPGPVDLEVAANDDLPPVRPDVDVTPGLNPSLPVSVLMEMARARLKPQLGTLEVEIEAAYDDQRAA